ncbi:KAP family P-loop NTPase fold protein [Pseudomonas izuensis]|uniref:KAP family P-loop NTPase fold protein n=1 Tax=Pseudomonas izuensis TaxID=2684212 RepID=UPI00135A6A00|nr:P-loop NTPase fold protein [Pseudomonas izuensis]
MQLKSQPLDVQLSPSISVRSDAPIDTDVVFLPTNSSGNLGELNTLILEQLDLPLKMPNSRMLAPGHFVQQTEIGKICYIVTIGIRAPADALQTYLANALNDPMLRDVRTLWIPLLGTGAGGLSYGESFSLIYKVLQNSTLITQQQTTAVISLPLMFPADQRESLLNAISLATPKVQNVVQVKPDPYSLHKSLAVVAVMEWANSLAHRYTEKVAGLSTTLLFFALAESQHSAAPPKLKDDRAADYFSAAIRYLAGDNYETIEARYFSRFESERSQPPSSSQSSNLLELTSNASDVVVNAHRHAGGTAESIIEIDHLIKALLNHGEARVHQALAAMGIASETLLAEYLSAQIGQVDTWFNNDVATGGNQLGHDIYAKAIFEFLTHAQTPPPLSISIQAPWGAGKSSLMQLIRENLDPREGREEHKPSFDSAKEPRLQLGTVLRLLDRKEKFDIKADSKPRKDGKPVLWTIWFNAWQYDTTEQVWAGMVDAIVSQVADRLPLLEREKFLFKLQLARIDDGVIRKRLYDRVISIWWSRVRAYFLAGCAATLSMLGIDAVGPALSDQLAASTGWGVPAAVLTQSFIWIGMAATYFTSRSKTREEPATFSLADYIRVPDYGKAVGELHQIHADLRRVLSVVPKSTPSGGDQNKSKNSHEPIVIFIDDLDRCAPGKIASVVEGVSMLLASDAYRCMFVIGMDPQMVAAALEKAHKDVRQQLPRYERAVPLGWRFMDKFIQLPFTIPPSNPDQFQGYVDWLVGSPEAPARKPIVPVDVEIAIPVPVPDEGTLKKNEAISAIDNFELTTSEESSTPGHDSSSTPSDFVVSRDVGAIIRSAAKYSANPREIKRMVNLVRFYLSLRAARRQADHQWRSPDRDQYARWIAITLRWPDMLRWLQWGADEAHWPVEHRGHPLVVRRLQLMERLASTSNTSLQWREALKTDLKVPIESDDDWACDAKLFEFFQEEYLLDERKRLSNAAARGFW